MPTASSGCEEQTPSSDHEKPTADTGVSEPTTVLFYGETTPTSESTADPLYEGPTTSPHPTKGSEHEQPTMYPEPHAVSESTKSPAHEEPATSSAYGGPTAGSESRANSKPASSSGSEEPVPSLVDDEQHGEPNRSPEHIQQSMTSLMTKPVHGTAAHIVETLVGQGDYTKAELPERPAPTFASVSSNTGSICSRYLAVFIVLTVATILL